MQILQKIMRIFEESQTIKSSRNPLSAILARYTKRLDLEVLAARFGFVLKIIYADGVVADEEKEILNNLLKKYLPEIDSSLPAILKEFLAVDNLELEMMYFAQVMNEKMDETQRQQFLLELFQIARADEEYAMIEENDIRIITKYLLLSHADFIKMRNQK
jgi:uncharacterized tellurite resistance protein B-like protein